MLLLLLLSSPARASRVDTAALKLTVDTTGLVKCYFRGDFTNMVHLEYFKWNKWVKIDSWENIGQLKDSCVTKQVTLFNGNNQFRLSAVKISDDTVVSRIVKVNKNNGDSCEGFRYACKLDSKIHFKCEQDWEIYDQYGSLVRKGRSADIELYDLQKGGYFLYYSNTAAEFFKQ